MEVAKPHFFSKKSQISRKAQTGLVGCHWGRAQLSPFSHTACAMPANIDPGLCGVPPAGNSSIGHEWMKDAPKASCWGGKQNCQSFKGIFASLVVRRGKAG